MKTVVRRPFGWLLVAALSFALIAAACEEDVDNGLFDDPDTPTPAAPTPAPPADTPTPAPTDDVDEPVSLRGDIEAVDTAETITGEVTLNEMDGEINVMVMIEEGLQEGTYAHGIAEGSCMDFQNAALQEDDDNGLLEDRFVHEFEELEVTDADMMVTFNDSFSGTLDDLRMDHVYVIYPNGENGLFNDDENQTPIACADLEEDDALDTAPGLDDDDEDDEDDDNGPTSPTTP